MTSGNIESVYAQTNLNDTCLTKNNILTIINIIIWFPS